jgi:single-strand DNA-binding protein
MMQTRKWQNKEGQDQYKNEIVADRMQMLGGRSSGGSYDGGMDQSSGGDDYNQAPTSQASAKPAASAAKPATSGSGFDDFEDDIPF